MLDIRLIREDPERVRAALERRGAGDRLDGVLELDARRRALLPELEARRARKNEASEEIAAAKRAGADASAQIEEMRALGAREKELTEEVARVEQELQGILASLPNLPAPDAPLEDTVLREVGEPRVPVRPPRDHLELAGGLIDIETAARASGSRFAYLKGELVLLELALVRWSFDVLMGEGYEPVIPPVLVREEAMFGTGMLPDTEQQLYRVTDDDLFLIGTSEVPLASLHGGQILEPSELPRRYAGFSTCFRREAGAAGRDTRGIFRVHQFDKVEMFSFVEPGGSEAEHERILGIQERILGALEIPYRVVDIAVDELGSSAAKKYDCDAWLPGQERYRELTSCSNTTDYQARRLDIRVRPEGQRPHPVHTLNGTAVAVGRTIIALLENGQREDGSVALPSCLVPYGAPERVAAAR